MQTHDKLFSWYGSRVKTSRRVQENSHRNAYSVENNYVCIVALSHTYEDTYRREVWVIFWVYLRMLLRLTL